MRLAFLGDIHGNLPALEAVWAVLEEKSPDMIFVTGDLVGYGADCRACVDFLRDKADFACLGNHDAVVCGKMIPWGFRPESLEPLERCREELSSDAVGWLASLPLVGVFPDVGWTVSHGSLAAPEQFPYVLSPLEARAHFAKQKTPFGCVGHSHVPGLFFEPRRNDLPQWTQLLEGTFLVPPEGRLLLNPGSVGQPRDGDHRASFALFDQDTREGEIVRVDYDIQEAARRIEAAGFARSLADRLFLGI